MAPPRGTSNEHNGRSPAPAGRRFGRRTLLAGAAATASTALLGATAGCARVPTAGSVRGGDLLQRLRTQGTVRLGIAGEQPFSYIGKNGELTGSEPALARAIFKRLGIPHVTPLPTEFNSLVAGLDSQQFDVICAGMYINPERCAQVLFADPHYQMRDAFIVRAGNPKHILDYPGIARARARMATGTGYAEADYARWAGVPDSRIMLLQDQLAGLLAVEQGRADVFSGTAVTVRNVVEQSRSHAVEYTPQVTPRLEDGTPHVDVGAFAFRRGETALRDAFNRELHAMQRSGEVLHLMRPFGFLPAEMTTRTAKEACRP